MALRRVTFTGFRTTVNAYGNKMTNKGFEISIIFMLAFGLLYESVF